LFGSLVGNRIIIDSIGYNLISMMQENSGDKIQEVLSKAIHVTLLTGMPPYPDALFSLMTWRNVLNELGVPYSLVAVGLDLQKAPGHIEHISEVSAKLPVQQTVLKLNLGEGHVEKVNYEEKEGSLVVYVTPKEGYIKKGDVQRIEDGIRSDVLITLGIHAPQDILQWPEEWPQWFGGNKTLINIDINSHNTAFGQINAIDADRSSLSELTTQLLIHMNWSIDPQSAELLYRGIVNATRQFKQFVKPETFEIAAYLLRHGATTQPDFIQDATSKSTNSESETVNEHEPEEPNKPLGQVQPHVTSKSLAHPIDL